jgi:molybdopterin molybdotransferase
MYMAENAHESKSKLLPFDSAWPMVAKRIVPLPSERAELLAAVGRVLRADGNAAWDLPMAENSAMDGFAVRSADTDSPAHLRLLTGDAYAGSGSPPPVESGTAVAIGTGGLLPPGADAVLIKEKARRDGEFVVPLQPAKPGDHIRRAGEELRAGEVVVPTGARLDPLQIAALAAAGVTEVEVSRRPQVCVLTSGTEVVPVGTAIRPGQVVNSNGPLLRLWIEGLLGAQVMTAPPLVDDAPALRHAFANALASADVLVVTGGVSVGDRDLVKQVLEEELGVERVFWRVAQKPGKPTYAGLHGNTWVVGLPGNPAAVAAMWYVLVRPMLLALMGATNVQSPGLLVRLASEVRPNEYRTHLRWCRTDWRNGEMWAEALGRSGSHMLSSFAQADLLAIIPPGGEKLPSGTSVQGIELNRG